MAHTAEVHSKENISLFGKLSDNQEHDLENASEEAWIEVIQKMDEVYAELVESQIALEKKHEELNKAHTKLNKTQQHLVQSEKMAALGRLVAGVAHELNNPISFVFGNMHALKNYGEKITTYLKAVDSGLDETVLLALRDELNIERIVSDIIPLVDGTLEGAERVSAIVQELKQFSGTQEQEAEEFSVAPVVQTAVNWVLRAAKAKTSVNIECPQNIMVFTRKGYVHQIIVNLVQNAVDVLAGQEDGQVTINCKVEAQKLCVCIYDNGDGISANDVDNIFEPFYTTKPIGKGTGLGLYVSYNMAKDLGGDLIVETPPIGGTLFKLMLPVRQKND